MTAVDAIAVWLGDILDEDETAARTELDLAAPYIANPELTVEYQWARLTRHSNGTYGSLFVPGAPSPQQVLAHIAADRQILDAYYEAVGWSEGDLDDLDGWAADTVVRHLARVVKMVASAYADRPGYREEWRP